MKRTRLKPYVANIHSNPFVIMLPETPTSEEHVVEMLQKHNLAIPEVLPRYVTGPFRTKSCANWVARNPRCRYYSIAEAERLAKHYIKIEKIANNYAFAV